MTLTLISNSRLSNTDKLFIIEICRWCAIDTENFAFMRMSPGRLTTGLPRFFVALVLNPPATFEEFLKDSATPHYDRKVFTVRAWDIEAAIIEANQRLPGMLRKIRKV